MADPRDDRVSAAYRALPGEGPPAALDAAIQAAARRAVGSRPARSRRWQVPLSIAAVLALAIGVSLQVEREKPVVVDGTPVSPGSAEYPVPQAAPEKQDRAHAPAPAARAPAVPAEAPSVREAPRAPAKEMAPVPEAKRAAPQPPAPAAEPAPSPAAFAPAPAVAPANVSAPATIAAPAPVAPPTAAPAARIAPTMIAPASPAPPAAAGAGASADALRAAPQGAARAKSELSREETAQEKVMAKALETPERRLERIAQLRDRGLHDEADRELAEFRRAFPDYRLTDEWRRKVERP
jgi:hypothetical protein